MRCGPLELRGEWAQPTNIWKAVDLTRRGTCWGFSARGQRAIEPQPRDQKEKGTVKSSTRKHFLVRSPVLLVRVCQRDTFEAGGALRSNETRARSFLREAVFEADLLAHFPDLHMFLFTSQCHEGRRDENTKASFASCFNYRGGRAGSPEKRGCDPGGLQIQRILWEEILVYIIEENSIPKMRGVQVSNHKVKNGWFLGVVPGDNLICVVMWQGRLSECIGDIY